jgi:hypothetical protein
MDYDPNLSSRKVNGSGIEKLQGDFSLVLIRPRILPIISEPIAAGFPLLGFMDSNTRRTKWPLGIENSRLSDETAGVLNEIFLTIGSGPIELL